MSPETRVACLEAIDSASSAIGELAGALSTGKPDRAERAVLPLAEALQELFSALPARDAQGLRDAVYAYMDREG